MFQDDPALDPNKRKPGLPQAAQNMGAVGAGAAPPTLDDSMGAIQGQMGAGGNTSSPSGMGAMQSAMGAGAGGAAPPQMSTPDPMGAGAGGAAPPTTGTQPWYTQQDIGTFQNWAQQRYGRQATPEELAQIGANSSSMQTAQTYADTLAQQQGWTPPAGAGGAATGPVGSGNPAIQAQLQQRLQQMLGTNIGAVDTNSQEYQSQKSAFARGQQRQLERAKNAAAERAASGGMLGSGGFEATQQAMDADAAGRSGDFEAQLATQQIMRQRGDLQQALQLAKEGGLANEARALQEKLGTADLELRKYLGKGQLGLGLLGTMLGDQRSRDALGFNYANLQNSMNQQTLQQLLGGL